MASLNKVFLMGNLTRDPELRYTTGGAPICGFGLAINRRFTTARGEEREEVCYVDIDVWGKQAESCNNYLRRGSQAFVEGRLRFDQWDDRETGRKRSRLTVTAERVQFLSGRDDGQRYAQGGAPAQGAPMSAPAPQQGGYQQQPAPAAPAPPRPAAPATPATPPPPAAPPAAMPQQAPPPPFPAANNPPPAAHAPGEQFADEDNSIDDIPF